MVVQQDNDYQNEYETNHPNYDPYPCYVFGTWVLEVLQFTDIELKVSNVDLMKEKGLNK